MTVTLEMRMAMAAMSVGLDPAVFWTLPLPVVLFMFARADRRRLS